jgi:hypothetical protein
LGDLCFTEEGDEDIAIALLRLPGQLVDADRRGEWRVSIVVGAVMSD